MRCQYKSIHTDSSLGLQVPSESVIAQQVVLNYIPTAFATFLEPWWVLLNRLLCILQPFEELRRQDSVTSRSIGLRYTSLPPQLNIWRAIRGRHFILSIVCVVALLAQPLTVTLSTLFFVDITSTAKDVLFTVPKLPLFNNSSLFISFDHFYVEKANMTQDTPLPPWVSSEYYFLPYFPVSSSSKEALWEVYTKGFGLDSQCHTLDENAAEGIVHFDINHKTTFSNPSSVQTFWEDSKIRCSPCLNCYADGSPQEGLSTVEISGVKERSALEICTSMVPILADRKSPDAIQCNSQIFMAWEHANFSNPDPTKEHSQKDFDVRAIVCRPKLRVADFLLKASSDGRVLSYSQTSHFDTDLDKYFAPNTSLDALLQNAANLVSQSTLAAWHNTAMANDWVNYLLTQTMKSTSLVDPTAPFPPYAELEHHVQSLHKSLFAIILSLNEQIFTPAPPNSTVSGKLWTAERRVFMDETMFWISLTILLINLVVAVAYYVFRPKRFLPRMPNSIASVLGFVAASSTIGESDDDRDEKWRFGKFVGVDGKPHVGIERAALVIPIDVKENKKFRRRRWRAGV